jgi:hypothetical protein
MAAASALLSGCAHEITVVHSDYDPQTQSRYTSVLAPMDLAGGERQTLLCQSDYYGLQQQCWPGHATGTMQGLMNGGFAGLMQGAGIGMGLGFGGGDKHEGDRR